MYYVPPTFAHFLKTGVAVMMPIRLTGSVSAVAFALATVWMLNPTPAHAGKRGIGSIIGIGAAAVILNEAAKAMNNEPRRSRGRRSRDSDDDDGDNASRTGGKPDPEAAARIARQLYVMQRELEEIARAQQMERDRNVENAIKEFIEVLISRHKEINTGDRVRATRGELNQVTAGQVKVSIEDAYEKANLREFEKYTGELWTRDRLLVRTLHYATKNLGPYFEGVGAKGPGMDDLKDLFAKSAREVFSKALETGEIVGVSKSFDRFIRTIYEYSDTGNEGLLTRGMDGQYERLTSMAIDAVWKDEPVEGRVTADTQGLDRQFLFRFRARRALYDCLSQSYPELLGGGSDGSVTTALTTTSTISTTVRQRHGRPSIVPSVSQAEREALSQKIRSHVGKVCQGSVPTILARAKSGSLGPVSSRQSGFPGSAYGVLPAAERR